MTIFLLTEGNPLTNNVQSYQNFIVLTQFNGTKHGIASKNETICCVYVKKKHHKPRIYGQIDALQD